MNKVSTAFLPVSFLFAGPGPVVRSKRVTLAVDCTVTGLYLCGLHPKTHFSVDGKDGLKKNGTDGAVPFREAVRCLTG